MKLVLEQSVWGFLPPQKATANRLSTGSSHSVKIYVLFIKNMYNFTEYYIEVCMCNKYVCVYVRMYVCMYFCVSICGHCTARLLLVAVSRKLLVPLNRSSHIALETLVLLLCITAHCVLLGN